MAGNPHISNLKRKCLHLQFQALSSKKV